MTASGALTEEALLGALSELEVEHEPGGQPGGVVVTLPGEHKLRTVCSLRVRGAHLRVLAFVVRHPEENHAAVYRHLLRRNLRLPGLAYALDELGDVYLTGRVPLAGLDRDGVDRLLGVVLTACDAPFDELLALGFLGAMRTEWAWRRSRGESTANLEVFRHLLEEPGPGPGAPA